MPIPKYKMGYWFPLIPMVSILIRKSLLIGKTCIYGSSNSIRAWIWSILYIYNLSNGLDTTHSTAQFDQVAESMYDVNTLYNLCDWICDVLIIPVKFHSTSTI